MTKALEAALVELVKELTKLAANANRAIDEERASKPVTKL